MRETGDVEVKLAPLNLRSSNDAWKQVLGKYATCITVILFWDRKQNGGCIRYVSFRLDSHHEQLVTAI
jgi:hypothetical protein